MKLGLCCLYKTPLTPLGEKRRFSILRHSPLVGLPLQDALPLAGEVIIHNLKTTIHFLVRSIHDKFDGYRMSSSIIAPLTMSCFKEVSFKDLPQFDTIVGLCQEIKTLSSLIRITTHPGPYVHLFSDNTQVSEASFKELELHAELFDLCGLKRSHWNPINIHLSNGWNEVMSNLKAFDKMSEGLRKRLVLENNDSGDVWSVARLASVSNYTGTPITFDNLHHKLMPDALSEKEAFYTAYDSWAGVEPVFHYSECVIDETRKKWVGRSHADMPTELPPVYDGLPVLWEVELKYKEFAIAKLRNMAALRSAGVNL